MGEGTRQNDTVTSGEGMPLTVIELASGAVRGRREMVAETVYQKHSTLQTRKWTYRV